jgi:hypothetical protein
MQTSVAPNRLTTATIVTSKVPVANRSPVLQATVNASAAAIIQSAPQKARITKLINIQPSQRYQALQSQLASHQKVLEHCPEPLFFVLYDSAFNTWLEFGTFISVLHGANSL